VIPQWLSDALAGIVRAVIGLVGADAAKTALDEAHAEAVAMQAARDAADVAEDAKFPP
jgi:hypothetical protein